MNYAHTAEKATPLTIANNPLPEIRPNILIVDDRKENLLATEKILKHLNAYSFKATSGNEALSLMLRHTFAVVLLDVQMPEMDGFETARLMQEYEGMQGTPIIFMTAISKEEKYATQAAEIGAVDYIFKPINPDILRSKVKVYLDLYTQREQILQLNATLRQSNEELERFSYICSHDMQEPVRMMYSYAELIGERYGATLDVKGRKYFDFMISNARHLQKMIQDILVFSRMGREEIELEKVDCRQLAEQVLSEFAPVIEEKNAVIHCGPLPVLHTSATLIHILLQNLIGNSLKFQDGSKLPEVSITAERNGNHWQFVVSDNGIGIDPRFHDKVFAIFQRIHRREDYPGTGIGLSTCKKFVELCGGSIRFESAPLLGTRFFFTIPCVET